MTTRAIILADHRATAVVAGLTLLKRAILSLKRIGITSCTIVTAEKKRLSDETSDTRIDIPVTWVETLAEARTSIDAPAYVVPAHHLYHPQILTDFSNAAKQAQTALVCAGAPTQTAPADIACKNGAVTGFGTAGADHADIGLWYCTPAVLDALAAPAETRNAALQTLAASGKIGALNVGEEFWMPVDAPQDIRPAEKKLLKTLIKPTDGFVSRHFNRRISLWMSRWLVKTPITPNQISLLTMFISLWSAWWIATGEYLHMALGGILFQFASILDGSDGEVAKLKFQQSPFGELVDTLADDLSFLVFFAAIAVGMYRVTREPYILTLGGVAVGLILLIFLAIHRFLKHAGTRSQVGFVTALSNDVPESKRGVFYRLSDALKFVCRRDFFSAGICLVLLVNGIAWVYWIVIVGVFWFATVVFGYTGYMLHARKR